jgi:hypothetical protein
MKLDSIMRYEVAISPLAIKLYPPTAISPAVLSFAKANMTNQVRAIITRPYRERSVGRHSQNAHIWGHIQAIAESLGDDVADVEAYCKMRAISRGYPYHICGLSGELKPDSMATISTNQASILIDVLHQIAADCGIILAEGD